MTFTANSAPGCPADAQVVRFHPDALQDADIAAVWYAERSLSAARGFVTELEHLIGVIAENPGRFQPFHSALRRAMFRRFPHYVVFRFDESNVEVLGVAHAKRRPGYWRDRMLSPRT
jgi:plasmid stabilization system protein ParE